MNTNTPPVPSENAIIDLIVSLFTGPIGLLIQLVAIGYILAAFVLYGFRTRFFHPDVINTYGAVFGGVAWVVVQAWTAVRHNARADAIPALGPLLAVPTVGSIAGRAHWLVVAQRNEDRRESITKWEYKTRASAVTLAAIAIGAAVITAPILTVLLTGVLAAVLVVPASGRALRWMVCLFLPFRQGTLVDIFRESLETPMVVIPPGDARRPNPDDEWDASIGETVIVIPPDGPGTSRPRAPARHQVVVTYANRPGDVVVAPAGLPRSRYAAAADLAAIAKAVATLGADAETVERIRLGVAERTNHEASGREVAIDNMTFGRIRAAARGVPGVDAIGEPLLDFAEGRGWRAVLSVVVEREGADEVLDGCAAAIRGAVPELGAILICREFEMAARRR
ncbi:MAG: hypothetical protein H0V25_01810 [Solirubrobacterales bacterium]|nr:hypothetical protein [Solirubrobacterales bacterium]